MTGRLLFACIHMMLPQPPLPLLPRPVSSELPLTTSLAQSHQQMRQFVMHKKPHSSSHLSPCVYYHALAVCCPIHIYSCDGVQNMSNQSHDLRTSFWNLICDLSVTQVTGTRKNMLSVTIYKFAICNPAILLPPLDSWNELLWLVKMKFDSCWPESLLT